MGVSETGRKCLLPTGVTLGSKEPVSHSVHKREQSLLGALRGETRILPPGQSGVSVAEERGCRWRVGCFRCSWGFTPSRGGPARGGAGQQGSVAPGNRDASSRGWGLGHQNQRPCLARSLCDLRSQNNDRHTVGVPRHLPGERMSREVIERIRPSVDW